MKEREGKEEACVREGEEGEEEGCVWEGEGEGEEEEG